MREHLSLEKKTTTGFSIPSLKHPVRGFGLDSPYAAPQAVPVQQARFQPRSHDLSRISMRPQAKLTVNQPGDIYEQEADRVAQQVMGRLGQPGNSQSIQREQMPEEEEELQEIVRQLPTAKTASTLTGDNIIQAKGAGDKIAAQLRIWKRILDKKQLPDNVYRIDSRTPEQISQTGFQPHNDNGNISIEEHVTGVLDQALANGNTLAKYESQYVSTAAYKGLKDAVLAQVSGGKYLYKIDTAAINLANASFTDVNDYFDRRRKPRPYPEQREWIKQGGIPGAAVRQYMNAQTFYTQEVDVVDGQIVLPDENSISRWQNMP